MNYQIKLDDAQLSHFRLRCDGDLESKSCKNLNLKSAVNDTSMWKYRDEIVKNVEIARDRIEKLEFDVIE